MTDADLDAFALVAGADFFTVGLRAVVALGVFAALFVAPGSSWIDGSAAAGTSALAGDGTAH